MITKKQLVAFIITIILIFLIYSVLVTNQTVAIGDIGYGYGYTQ